MRGFARATGRRLACFVRRHSELAMSRNAIITVIAGLLLPLLWTPLENILFSWLLTAPPSSWHFRALQVLIGAASAAVLVLPLALLVRPGSWRYGALFVVAFLLSVLASTWLFGGGENLPATLALIDLWVFLLAAFGCFWWAAPRNIRANAA